jgi:plastocyanin
MKTALLVLLGIVALTAGVGASQGAAPAPEPTTHEVKMALDGETYRFVPEQLSIRTGDRVRFVMTSGAPHNVAFEAERIPEKARAKLAANMADQISPLAGPLLTREGESYVVSFAGVDPGVYPYFCMPHMAMNMKGTITVRP